MPAEGATPSAPAGGRLYLVTNACSGAGLAAARELLHAGAAIVLTGPNAAVVQRVVVVRVAKAGRINRRGKSIAGCVGCFYGGREGGAPATPATSATSKPGAARWHHHRRGGCGD